MKIMKLFKEPSKEELIKLLKLQTELQDFIDALQAYKAILESAIDFFHLIQYDPPIGSVDNIHEPIVIDYRFKHY